MATFNISYPLRAMMGIEDAPGAIELQVEQGFEMTLGEAYCRLAERYPQLAFLMSDSEEDVTFRGSLYAAVDGHTSNCAVVDDTLLVGPNSNVTFFMAYRGG